jgi:hypothetical protein
LNKGTTNKKDKTIQMRKNDLIKKGQIIKKRFKVRSQSKKKKKKINQSNKSIPKKLVKCQNVNKYKNKIKKEIKGKDSYIRKSNLKNTLLLTTHEKKKFCKFIYDTWNPNQFKIQSDNVIIPLNPKFPIKKINFNSGGVSTDISEQISYFKSKENNLIIENSQNSNELEKLSIEKMRENVNNGQTPQGFHQMFVSMANEFSPSWRDQLNKIMK